MNKLVIPNVNRTVTLNSQEIASLCDKPHYNVLIEICQMCKRLNINHLKFQEIYFDTHNRQQMRYKLDQRHALILASGYDIRYRDQIVKRIVDMEALTPNEFVFYQAANLVAMERQQKARDIPIY